MIDQSQLQETPPLTAIHEVVNCPRRVARPAGRTVAPGTGAGRRGFLVLLVSGLAINVWAFFPSAVESGILVPLPQTSIPSAADANSAGEGVADDLLNLSRELVFKLMNGNLLPSTPTIFGPVLYASAAVTVAVVPLRSKLQAFLLFLYARYGHSADVMALELKLQALLRLPDSVLAQLMEHPDLAGLKPLLDGVFLAPSDLTGIKTELDKIIISSTLGPTEQIDVVKVNGEPTFVVQSPAVPMATASIAASQVSVLPQPPVDFAVVSWIEAPAEMAAFMMAPSVESFAPEPEPEPEPVPVPTEQIMAEFTVLPTVEPAVIAAPTSTMPTSPEEPNDPPETPVDITEMEHEFEPDETFTSGGGDDPPTEQDSVPSAGAPDADAPHDNDETGGTTHDTGGSSADADDGGGGSSPSEPSP